MSAAWVLCCGEAVYDVTTTDAEHLLATVGGGPTYAALAIARVGAEAEGDVRSALWAGLPQGLYGERIARTLERQGVDTGFLTPSTSPPTMALTSPRGTSVAYEIFAEGTSAFDVTSADAPDASPTGAPFHLVHLGGLGTAIAPMADALRTAVPRWSQEGSLIGYDPNIRDGFADRGQGVTEVEEWFRLSDIVKVSTEDLEALYGETPAGECVRRILDLGARLVILTDGPGPVSAHTQSASASLPVDPWPDDVLPVGAGDSFIAGVYVALLSGTEDLENADEPALRALLRTGLDSVARHARR